MAKILHRKLDPGFLEKLLQLGDYNEQVEKLQDQIEGDEEDKIMCEYVVSFLSHLQECGLPIRHIPAIILFTLEFMRNTCNSSLVNALRTLQQTLLSLDYINKYQMRCVLDHINNTYLQHFHLYKYVLTLPRERDYTYLTKDVHTAPEPASMGDGVEEFQWRYQERVKCITAEHDAALSEARSNCQTRAVKPLDKRCVICPENMGELVSDYVRGHCENIENEVKLSLRSTEIALQKEIAVIEAGRMRNKDREASIALNTPVSVSPPKKSKQSLNSASPKRRSPTKK